MAPCHDAIVVTHQDDIFRLKNPNLNLHVTTGIMGGGHTKCELHL